MSHFIAGAMSVATDEMETERSERLDEAFSECVARVVCLRPVLYVKSGEYCSLASNDPPTRDVRIAMCRSCKGPMRGCDRDRVLCRGCRANPIVLESAPLITTMYHSANPKYILDAEAKAMVAHIGHQREIANEAQLVARQLAYLSFNVYERWRRHKGNRNVHFTPERVRNCSYERELTYCNPRYSDKPGTRQRHVAVTLGGIGPKLCDVVKQAALTWLYNLDAIIRAHFNISLERRPNDASVRGVVEDFATLISRRVALLETPDDDPTTHLCTQGFEWVAKIQFVKCEHHAAGRRRADIRAMSELISIASDESPPEHVHVQPLINFLAAPCPELLKALPSVATDMQFGTLGTTLARPHEEQAAPLALWRASVPTGSLCMLLEAAIRHTQQWKPSLFLNCLRHHKQAPARPLPAQGWVDSAHIGSWSLINNAVHAQRRTGLDPTGQRIVLLSSALMQLSGDGHFFVPGVVRCEMMNTVCAQHEYVSTHAYNSLSEQMWPYMAGEPWRASREQLLLWQGSHMEDDVRRAASLLGGFSLDEIARRFARRSDRLSEVFLNDKLVSTTTRKMVHKPEARYDEWFPVAVDLLLPILAQLRQSAGIGTCVVSDPLVEVLRLNKSVRDWNSSSGDLRITAGEAHATPELKRFLVRLLREGSPLVRFTRPRRSSVNCWILNGNVLATALKK